MPEKSATQALEIVQRSLYLLRGQRVMLDFDLAAVYGVPVRQIRIERRRDCVRFPTDFAFQLNQGEFAALRTHLPKLHPAPRELPWAFTEEGAIALSAVLTSPLAVQVSVAFVRSLVRNGARSGVDIPMLLSPLEGPIVPPGCDTALSKVFAALRSLAKTPPGPNQL